MKTRTEGEIDGLRDIDLAIRSMADYNDMIELDLTDSGLSEDIDLASTDLSAYGFGPNVLVKAIGNQSDSSITVLVKTYSNTISQGYRILRVPADGQTGKQPRIRYIKKTGSYAGKINLYTQTINQ